MQIRKGKVEENEAIAKHLLLAMEDIAYLFIGDRNYDKALHFMKTLVGQQETNIHTITIGWFWKMMRL